MSVLRDADRVKFGQELQRLKTLADPSSRMTFDLEDAVNDSGASGNRLVPPGGTLGEFNDNSKNVPGTDLAAGSAIGN